MLENGKEECNCKKKGCERHGKCAECLEHHKNIKREVYCKRSNTKSQAISKKSKEINK